MKFTNVSDDTRQIGYVEVPPGDDWEPAPELVPGLLGQVGGGVWAAGDDEATAAVAAAVAAGTEPEPIKPARKPRTTKGVSA